jgi:hypothetical protein
MSLPGIKENKVKRKTLFILFLSICIFKYENIFSQLNGVYYSENFNQSYNLSIEIFENNIELKLDSSWKSALKLKATVVRVNDTLFRVFNSEYQLEMLIICNDAYNKLTMNHKGLNLLFYQIEGYINNDKSNYWILSTRKISAEDYMPVVYAKKYFMNKKIPSGNVIEEYKVINYLLHEKHGKEYINYVFEELNPHLINVDDYYNGKMQYYGNPPKIIKIWRHNLLKKEKYFPLTKYVR